MLWYLLMITTVYGYVQLISPDCTNNTISFTKFDCIDIADANYYIETISSECLYGTGQFIGIFGPNTPEYLIQQFTQSTLETILFKEKNSHVVPIIVTPHQKMTMTTIILIPIIIYICTKRYLVILLCIQWIAFIMYVHAMHNLSFILFNCYYKREIINYIRLMQPHPIDSIIYHWDEKIAYMLQSA